MRLGRQLVSAVRGSVLIRLAALLIMSGSSILLARALGPLHYGTYAYALAIVSVLTVPSQLGVPALILRETAKASAVHDYPAMRGLWVWGTRRIIRNSLFVALLCGAIFVLGGRGMISSSLKYSLVIGLFLVPLIALGNARGSALRGLRFIIRGQLPETIVRPGIFIIFVTALWWRAGEVSSAAAMTLHVVASLVAFCLGVVILRRCSPPQVRQVAANFEASEQWRRSTIPLAWTSALVMGGSQAGMIIVGFFREADEVASYKIAVSAATIALFGLHTTSLVAGPHIARLLALRDRTQTQILASVTTAAATAMTLPVLLLVGCLGENLVGALYGPHYRDAWMPLLILCGGQLATAVTGSCTLLLNMSGNERTAAKVLAMTTLLSLPLYFALVPRWGAVGAAAATSVSAIAASYIFWRKAKEILGLDGGIVYAAKTMAKTRGFRSGRG